MEKIDTNTIKRIAITGPECSGKTTLAEELAKEYNTQWVPEYARKYLTYINHTYTYNDVEMIAKGQLVNENLLLSKASKLIFCDTDLLVIKVWMEVRFNKCPEWITQKLATAHYQLHLLCKPDLQWVADPLRENPNDRDYLFSVYKNILDDLNLPYQIIDGIGNERTDKAKKAITLLAQ